MIKFIFATLYIWNKYFEVIYVRRKSYTEYHDIIIMKLKGQYFIAFLFA